MNAFFDQRIAYGRSIRQRAACLRDSHGAEAEAAARSAAAEPGVTAADRSFWEAVAARAARETAAQRVPAVD